VRAHDAVEVEGGDVHAHGAARLQHGPQHRHELGRERLHFVLEDARDEDEVLRADRVAPEVHREARARPVARGQRAQQLGSR